MAELAGRVWTKAAVLLSLWLWILEVVVYCMVFVSRDEGTWSLNEAYAAGLAGAGAFSMMISIS